MEVKRNILRSSRQWFLGGILLAGCLVGVRPAAAQGNPLPCAVNCSLFPGIVVNAEPGQCDAAVDYPLVQPVGDCGPLQYNPPAGTRFPAGLNTVVVSAADGLSSCSFTVEVKDVDPPTINCPPDIIADASGEGCGVTVNYTVEASDGCGPVSVETFPSSGSWFLIGDTTVDVSAMDSSGNMTTCSFTVTVRDVTPPVIECPDDIEINLEGDGCGAEAYFEMYVYDNCTYIPVVVPRDGLPGIGDVTVEYSHESGSVFPTGVTDVTTTATDASGNFSVCTFKVIVREAEAPSVACPRDMDVPAGDGVNGVIADYFAYASDNCSEPSVTYDPPVGSLLPVGDNPVVVTATDASGNETSCTFTVRVRDANPGMDAGWIPSGLDSGPEYIYDSTSVDDVDVVRSDEALSVIVRPSPGRYRIAGWANPGILNRDDVAPGHFVRGKFYVTTSNDFDAPLNQVPNFRLRLQNEGSVLASATYGYAATGSGAVPHETFYDTVDSTATEELVGPSLRPSAEEAIPSLYRLDFAPLDVPASQGTKIGALFESCATQNPADGTLKLTEVSLGIYPSPTEGQTISFWSNHPAYAEQRELGGGKQMVSGVFNAEPNFEAGRRQALQLPERDLAAPFATVAQDGQAGWVIDTDAVPQDRFGAGLLSILHTDPELTPRVQEEKIYQGRFLVSSDVPTGPVAGSKMQGNVLLGLKTGMGALTARLELAGPTWSVTPGSTNEAIAAQVLPGVGSMIPEQPEAGIIPQGEAGGWYTLQISTPLDRDIGHWNEGDYGPFFEQPGPGEGPETQEPRNIPGEVFPASPRDLMTEIVGIQMPEQLKMGPDTTMTWSTPNRAKLRIIAVEILEYEQVDDGGYGYFPPDYYLEY